MIIDQRLSGRRIIVTRPESRNGPLCAAIRREGGTPVHVPVLRIEPVAFGVPGSAEIAASASIVFTSANAVRHFGRKLSPAALHEFAGHEGIAVVGPATARALEEFECTPALIAGEHVAECLAAELGVVEGQRVLWPRGDLTRDVFSQAMRRKRATLIELVVYRTVPTVPQVEVDTMRVADAITFTSPSGVFAWLSVFGPPSMPVACIGPITAQAAANCGLEVAGVADPYTLTGLVQTLRKMLPDALSHIS